MSEADPLEQVARAASELVPQLAERLAQLGLGEIEVRQGDLRVRAKKALDGVPAPAAAKASAVHHAPASDRVAVMAAGPSAHGVTSPAVGFFVHAEGLEPGRPVDKGDELGHVEMLGVRHDVRAPRRGTVRSLVTEAGQAVEYGQLLIELEAAE